VVVLCIKGEAMSDIQWDGVKVPCQEYLDRARQREIQEIAYYKWLAEGRPDGRDLDHWDAAVVEWEAQNGLPSISDDTEDVFFDGGITAYLEYQGRQKTGLFDVGGHGVEE
jgi:hypothetical protein